MRPTPSQKAEAQALEPWVGRWQGKTVAVLASGPSLTAEDAERVRHLPTIVTNDTYRLAPWADTLVAFDVKWWKTHGDAVAAVFAGRQVTGSKGARAGRYCIADVAWLESFRNSGAVAVALAIVGGAERVLMLGFDCQRTGGKTHWHGDHPANLGNAVSLKQWPRTFAAVARYAKRVGRPVLNCSRESALQCFPRVQLDEALA